MSSVISAVSQGGSSGGVWARARSLHVLSVVLGVTYITALPLPALRFCLDPVSIDLAYRTNHWCDCVFSILVYSFLLVTLYGVCVMYLLDTHQVAYFFTTFESVFK